MNEQHCRAFAGRLVIQLDVVYASRGHQKRYFRPSWISRALLLAEMIWPNDPGLVICPVAALTRPAGDGDRIQVANRVRKIHLIESIRELRAELDVQKSSDLSIA